jgi:hypothetical protein
MNNKKAQLQLKDSLRFIGEFEAYSLKDNSLLYSDNNQIQSVGARTIARLMCLGQYGKEKPIFSNIKASISLATASDRNALTIPGEFSNEVVEASEFYNSIQSNVYKEQYIECNGIFSTPPPSFLGVEKGNIVSEPYRHFGLYLSSMTDIEEYLFAYKYIKKGIIYPEGFGIRIKWKIKFL